MADSGRVITRRRRLAALLLLLGCLLVGVAGPVGAATRPKPRCVVVGLPPTSAAPAGNVVVTVPRLRCSGEGHGGGGAGGSGQHPGKGAGGGSAAGGRIPFTGWDAQLALEVAGTLLVGGGLLVGIGRRRLRTT